MAKKPTGCKYGLTIMCPHWDKPEMERLFTKYKYNYPSEVDIEAANLICVDCDSFEPFNVMHRRWQPAERTQAASQK